MPVLVEMTSLVLPRRLLQRRGIRSGQLGSTTAAEDADLTVLAYEDHDVLRAVLDGIARTGWSLEKEGEPGEIAIVDQLGGPGLWWPWLELAELDVPGGRVLAVRHAGTGARELATPVGWRFEGSASDVHGVGRLPLADRPLRHVRRDPDADVYLDRWTGEEARLPRSSPPVRVTVEGTAGARVELVVEVASGEAETDVGLMFRESLPPDGGMFFRFDRPLRGGFWMKNTLVPLDILFVEPGGVVVEIAERAEPLRLRMHAPARPVREVLEVPGGWCAAHGVGPGARVRGP